MARTRRSRKRRSAPAKAAARPAGSKSPAPAGLRRVAYLAVALVCLLSPVLVLVGMWCLKPKTLELWYSSYTGLPHGWFRGVGKHPLSRFALTEVLPLYATRVVVETVVRIVNVLTSGLALGGAAAVGVLAAHVISLRLRPAWWAWPAAGGGLLVLTAAAGLLWGAPAPMLLALLVGLVFALNFPPADLRERLERHGRLRPAVTAAILVTTFASHLLAPAAVLVFVAWCIRPGSARLSRVAAWIGRAGVCLVALPALALAFLSCRPIALSPNVRQVMALKGLYDVEIDPRGERVLVSSKYSHFKYFQRGFCLDLNDLARPPIKFTVRTIEFEDMALDVEGRRFYHVNPDNGRVMVFSVDTFELVREGWIPIGPSGSTNLELATSVGRLFVIWENGNLSAVDLESLTEIKTVPAGQGGSMLVDAANGRLYLNYGLSRTVGALDLRTLEVAASADGPSRSVRMALSDRRRELYVAATLESEVWVYSTPDLKRLRTIRADFGVRALAVDDRHGLLLAASAFTGYVNVIDLDTGKTVQRHYVGPYGRVMRVLPSRRLAFITITKSGLYSLKY